MKKRKFIVGDCFETFNSHTDVINLKKFKGLDPYSGEVASYEYIIGQGISLMDLEEIKINKLPLYSLIKNTDIFKKNPHLVHKRKIENCHITLPEKISDTEYLMNVVVDSQCCELSDHITGEHINGVVLIEATRQAFIAVTQTFFLNENDKIYFILKKLTCEFESFLFPLTIQMKYKILNFEKKGDRQLNFEAETICYHHDEKEKSCVIKGFFSVYPKAGMENLESELANNAVETFYV